MIFKKFIFIILLFCINLNLFAQDAAHLAVRKVEESRIKVIEKISPSVVCVFGLDQNGGGSGVLFQKGGYALTNFHVVQSFGLKGFGGVSDGNLYPLETLGIDPGGDLAIVKLTGKETFHFAPLGDSNKVRPGDFALVLGNPFLLADDYTPTVTYGIVSGINRYQEGQGNLLVYGNCIQIDSSINPGNSGGPLFSDLGFVIGINGRGSFEERGRVNVGLGYAISMEQAITFIPDLLATKLCMHGTLNAIFSDQGNVVVCSKINIGAVVAKAGLSLGDLLIEFDGIKILTANQFTNIIATYPSNWPVNIKFKNRQNDLKSIWIRLSPLPYESQNSEDEKEVEKPKEKQNIWGEFGNIRDKNINQREAWRIYNDFKLIVNPSNKKYKTITYMGKILIDKEETEEFVFTYAGKEKQILVISNKTEKNKEYLLNCFANQLTDSKQNDKSEAFKLLFEKVSFLYGYSLFIQSQKEDIKEILLLGGDKANNKRAYKLKVSENNQTQWNLWVNVVNEKKEFFSQLLKVGYSLENFESDYGEILDGFQKFGDCLFPTDLKLVYGLEEKIIRQIKIESIQVEE